MTTVHVPAREIGANAATILTSILETHGGAEARILPTELIVRDSSGPPPTPP
jgi:DNA-binding LacI/PurR family transcriptional regulator